ncbi:MAG: protein-L-isoaspartate(D-aspartate) O-methyltransferase [Gammaproteobacteria bacterium]|nr:protein-L-isoaspartate(D-aspartate) O-methyltransferase [Gammaproteobacteria bacterium]MBU1722322.1 protein-L-isoaspartate(D-aspartate) O-methyltransferase [Gammaproteobacteria bacterium]MBU2006439.1 protein-L-isoaspartate(D-aspartate) O-methyltransferase [Gammaproteobacteria bacterium]
MAERELDVEGIGMTSQRTRNRLVERLREKGIRNEDVLYVMSKVPRHLFVDEAMASRSYEDTALPIGYGQTISQPYIVARMTELLLEGEIPPQKVLEVGTGSGYQAAVLAPLVKTVITVERIEPLFSATRALLRDLGYRNIRTFLSDGSWGLAQEAPFDAIIVTAAPEKVPPALLEQLAIGGRLVIPTGGQGRPQVLQVITRLGENEYATTNHEYVQFVPMISGL